MRQFLLTLLVLTIAACSPGAGRDPGQTVDAPTRLTSLEVADERAPRESQLRSDDPWLRAVDQAVLASPVDPRVPATAPSTPLSGGFEDFHSTEVNSVEPIVPRPPPDPSDALDVVTWVGHALLNYDLDDPVAAEDISQYLSPQLALEFQAQSVVSAAESGPSSRALLVSAWVKPSESTSTLVDAVSVFEQAIWGLAESPPELGLAYIDVTAVLTDGGWQIVEMQVSFA